MNKNTNQQGLANGRPKPLLRPVKPIGVASALMVALLAIAPSVHAAEPTFSLAAGLGCEFPLNIYIKGGNQQVKQFTDKNGSLVRQLSAGRGTVNTFENADTGAQLTIKPTGGSVTNQVFNSDGSITFTQTGHNTIVLFPSDIPAGPTTTLYVGRVTFTIDAQGVFTLGRTSGRQVDICAALSG